MNADDMQRERPARNIRWQEQKPHEVCVHQYEAIRQEDGQPVLRCVHCGSLDAG
jgi:hypothetical protein